jgi:KipI family sensor histidine kinase inhibitor
MSELPMRRYGESGLLLELSSSARVATAYRVVRAALEDGRLGGVGELVPGAQTMLITSAAGDPLPAEELRALLAGLGDPEGPGDPVQAERPPVVIPVHYDGEDLELVARTAELSVPEVIELHSGAEYTVAFLGFAPGFGYLIGLPEPLHQARLADSRPRVPAGSVGVAGEFSAVYPRSSPGGWRLLGHTTEVLFDPEADPPARLASGDRVRFEPVR